MHRLVAREVAGGMDSREEVNEESQLTVNGLPVNSFQYNSILNHPSPHSVLDTQDWGLKAASTQCRGSGMAPRSHLLVFGGLAAILAIVARYPRPIFLLLATLSLLILTSIITLALSAAKESLNVQGPSRHARRRSALRTLTFTSPSAWQAVLTRQQWEDTPIHGRTPGLSAALSQEIDQFLKGISLTFILPWYSRLSPSAAFPNALEQTMRLTVGDLTRRACAVDWPGVVVGRILPLVTSHVHHYRSVEHLSDHTSRSPRLPLPLPKKVHPALKDDTTTYGDTISPNVEEHLRRKLRELLAKSLPEADRSEVTQLLAREVVLNTILGPTFNMLCDSDFWNRMINDQGGQYLREQ